MKIGFRSYDDNQKNEVYVNNKLIGHVEVNIWNQKWKIYPYFNFGFEQQSLLYTEYDSFYKAGKKMVDLYNGTIDSFEDIGENDTDEIDMRDIFKMQKQNRKKRSVSLKKPKP